MEALFMEFLNTRWSGSGEPHSDPLLDQQWVKEFIERWHLPAQQRVSTDQANELVSLRTLLGEVVTAIATNAVIPSNTLEQINAHLRSTPLHYELGRQGADVKVTLDPVLADWSGVLRGIVLSFAVFVSEHDPRRIRECQNPECRWVFYDETKNASRKWCGNTCASLVKVRRFRERRRSKADK